MPIPVNIPAWEKENQNWFLALGFFPCFVGGWVGGCVVGVFSLVEGCVGGFGVFFFYFFFSEIC